MYFLNNLNNRLTYEVAAQAMADSGITAQRSKCTWGYIRSEIPLSITGNQYRVPILINDNTYGSPNTTERRLQLQDAFIVGSVGMFLACPATAAAYAAGAYQLLSYPSLQQFTAPQQLAMTALYNGSMSLMVGQNMLTVNWDLWQHWVSNQTMAAAATDLDQNNFCSDGFYPNEPSFVHIGSTNIVMNINLPAAISVLPSSPVLTKLVIIQRGILAQNVTSVTNS